jgi:hypothetical protein|tara:strand:+ start:746 stop:1099 length:354 start_codon:yes stop_codon:yes gene_type:complete
LRSTAGRAGAANTLPSFFNIKEITMLESLKPLWAKWKVHVSVVGGALVVATAYGTCQVDPGAVSTNTPTETTTNETVEVSAMTTGTTTDTTTNSTDGGTTTTTTDGGTTDTTTTTTE